MTYTDMLGRRSLILKRHIGQFILKDNRHGLSMQENKFYNNMLRELYQNESELNSAKKH